MVNVVDVSGQRKSVPRLGSTDADDIALRSFAFLFQQPVLLAAARCCQSSPLQLWMLSRMCAEKVREQGVQEVCVIADNTNLGDIINYP